MTVDLAGWLLERIAEDERDALDGDCKCPDDRDVPRPDCAGRIERECAVKRELIGLHPEAVAEPLRAGAAWAYDEVLRRLALSYNDHPDYRDEWRP